MNVWQLERSTWSPNSRVRATVRYSRTKQQFRSGATFILVASRRDKSRGRDAWRADPETTAALQDM